MISGKDQNIFRIITFHIAQILINGIGCTGIPFTVIASLIRWKYGHSTIVPIEIPRNADADMCIQPEWLILRQHTNRINPELIQLLSGKSIILYLPPNATAGLATSDVRTPSLLP